MPDDIITVSKSYPYMSIAKKYNAPYALVLEVADWLTHRRGNHDQVLASLAICANYGPEFEKDMTGAADYFMAVRSGVIPFQ